MTALCECGCGQPAPIAKSDYASKGHVKGEPIRFVNGHNMRGKPKSAETRQRISEYQRNRTPEHRARLIAKRRERPATSTNPPDVHSWLNRWYPKKGLCEECGAEGRTDYAYLHHPEPYRHDRDSYREMCRRCHMASDGRLERMRREIPALGTQASLQRRATA